MMGSMMAHTAPASPLAASRISILVSCHVGALNADGPRLSRSPRLTWLEPLSFRCASGKPRREAQSLGPLKRLHTRQIDRQPFLFFRKVSRFIRAHPLDLDAQRALEL